MNLWKYNSPLENKEVEKLYSDLEEKSYGKLIKVIEETDFLYEWNYANGGLYFRIKGFAKTSFGRSGYYQEDFEELFLSED